MAPDQPKTPVHRYVDIPCPTRKHPRSLVAFRSHTVAAMFCIPCAMAWTEPTTRAQLHDVPHDKDDGRES